MENIRHMIEHIKFAKEMNVPNPVQVENGDIVKLYPGNPRYTIKHQVVDFMLMEY